MSGIKWSKKRKVESNYGMGGKPVSRGFDLIISFANPMASDDWTTTNITLKGCIFTEDGMESSQDDTNITHEFDLNPFDIQIGAAMSI